MREPNELDRIEEVLLAIMEGGAELSRLRQRRHEEIAAVLCSGLSGQEPASEDNE